MKAQTLTRETIRDLGVVSKEFPAFEIGDHIAVSQWITEGNKKRLQIFEGDVIAMHKNGASSTFTVRKIGANSVAVERIYPFYSPIIDAIKVVRKGDVRRAKLYYLRDRIGKAAQVKEKVLSKEAREHARQRAKEVQAAKEAKAQVEKKNMQQEVAPVAQEEASDKA